MNDLSFDDPCLIFALRREVGPFWRLFPPQERFTGSPVPARFCGPAWLSVLTVESGVGPERARRAVEWALGQPSREGVPYRPKLVLAVGYGGALTGERRVGDLVLATEVVDEAGRVWPVSWPGELPGGAWKPPLHRGRVLTLNRLVAGPEEKAHWGEKSGAAVVDMESAEVARVCLRHGVPFGCLRAVSDDVQTPLDPRVAACLAGGRVAPVRLAGLVARRPALVGQLWTLARHTRLASRQLALALGELLTLTLPFVPEE